MLRFVSAFTVLFSIALAVPAVAGNDAGLPAWTGDRAALLPPDAVAEWRSPHLDVPALLAEDDLNASDLDIPWRVGYPMAVDVSPSDSGTWEDLPGGGRLWRLNVVTEGALWTVLGFDVFQIQPGGRMSVYNALDGTVMGPYGSMDIRRHGELWFPPIAGGNLVVELYWPAELAKVEPAIHLGTVSHGYKPWGRIGEESSRVPGSAGSCNIDTTCSPEADAWQDDKRGAVMVLVGGSGNCSGALVNTTAGDCRPYLLTAAHCGENGPSTTIGFNYECSTCGCTTDPGTITAQTLTGGTLLGNFASSDFTLIEMDQAPPESFNAYFMGWSRDPNPAQMTWVISYPRGDVRKIAHDSDPPVDGSNWGPNHWRIDDSNPDPAHLAYEWGTTEPASSGSPLLDQDHRVIGQLHGGTASCSSDTYDEYGKVAVSWAGGGTSASRLADWLDPLAADPVNNGAMFVDGVDHQICLFQPTGSVLFDKDNYGCSDTLAISLRDDNIPGDPPTIDVAVSSATEIVEETVTLTQLQPGVGRYQGTIPTSTVAPVNGDGQLSVADGDILTVIYLDADDGLGGVNVTVKDNADVDCQAPVIQNVAVTQIAARGAVVTVDVDEAAQVSVPYGLVCGVPDDTAVSSTLQAQHDVALGPLAPETTYYLEVEATDEAGNTASDDNGGACYSFTTPVVPDFFTEQFTAGVDLAGSTVTFSPNGSVDYYEFCTESGAIALPTDPAGGTDLGLGDDTAASFTLGGGALVNLYGTNYDTVWVGPNGYLTFGAGDSDYTETFADHFSLPRVAALFDDLNPSSGGSVSWKQLADRVAVTWDAVPELSTSNTNTFQIEMFFDGRIRITWLQIDVQDAIVGLSAGLGLDPDFLPTDLSNASGCGPRPPRVSDMNVQTGVDVPVGIALAVTDDGLPAPPALNVLIERLPSLGTLTDSGTTSPILTVPYVLAGGGNAVTYTPAAGAQGWDSFDYSAHDGGTPPDGGASGIATVGVTVGGTGVVDEFLVDDTDPGWAITGGWAFGTPTGGGSHNLDPTSGATGVNVYGYNLNGDYADNMAQETLTSGPVDLSGVIDTTLEFQRWLGVESASYDHATVEVSTDGSTWTTLWDHTGAALSESAWSLQSYDISAIGDGQPSVQFRWIMGTTDGSVTYPGWNVDDIRVLGLVPAPCAGPPLEVTNVGFSPDKVTLLWNRASYASGGAPVYDALRSLAADDFDLGGTCLATDVGVTSAVDGGTPAAGEVFHYLVRPQNECGVGSLGAGRSGLACD
jgi:hypothetical protein